MGDDRARRDAGEAALDSMDVAPRRPSVAAARGAL
jgi:hypothetical protein